jgi:hypothetical protein
VNCDRESLSKLSSTEYGLDETIESWRGSKDKIEQSSTSSIKETIRATSRDFLGFKISKEAPPCEMVATACVVASIGVDA